jgi:hypothetical protein
MFPVVSELPLGVYRTGVVAGGGVQRVQHGIVAVRRALVRRALQVALCGRKRAASAACCATSLPL